MNGNSKKFHKTVPASLNTYLAQSLPVKQLKQLQTNTLSGASVDCKSSPPNVNTINESKNNRKKVAVVRIHERMVERSASIDFDKLRPPTTPSKSTIPHHKHHSSEKESGTPNRWSMFRQLTGTNKRGVGSARNLEERIQTQKTHTEGTPTPACDSDFNPSKSTVSGDNGGGSFSLGTIVSVARNVDREREMHLIKGSRMNSGVSDSGSIGTEDTEDSDPNPKQRRIIGELRLQTKALKRENRRVQKEKDSLIKQLDNERKENFILLKESKKQAEERSSKLLCDLKAEMRKEIEDLTEKLRCREETISSLDTALTQMRSSRFSQKTKTHKRRGTAPTVSTIIEVGEISPPPKIKGNIHIRSSTLRRATSDIIDNKTSSRHINQTHSNTNEFPTAEALNIAIEANDKEHEASMAIVKKQLRLKEELVNKLVTKIDKMKKSRSQVKPSHLIMLRNTSMNSELIETSTQRLESVVQKLDQFVENTADSGIDVPDEMVPIRRIASKISLVNDEVKISMKLIEQKMLNTFESIGNDKIDVNEVKQSKMNEGGSLTQNEVITAAKSQSMKMLQETETSINGRIDELKEKLRDIQSEMEAKEDMIEALKLA